VTAANLDVGWIYFLWPALGYGGDVGTEYYGAITSKGIQIISQLASGKWELNKTLVKY
jgi:hypothetical protein